MTYSADDKVYVISHYNGTRIDTVERVTKMHAVVGGQKFRLKDGLQVGGSAYFCTRIEPLSSEWGAREYENTRRAQLRTDIQAAAAACLSLDALSAALVALNGVETPR